MRILVHEFVSGGGLAGCDVPGPLFREGGAMLTALVRDLAALRRHEIVTTRDPRFVLAVPRDVEVMTLFPGQNNAVFDALVGRADAAWLVAPETGGCLARLAARVERKRRMLLGPGAAAIRFASNKAALPRRLALQGVRHPATRVLRTDADPERAAKAVGYPVVVKPVRGAGCTGVCLARNARELYRCIAWSRRSAGRAALLIQEYVTGVAASVSLLTDGRRAVPLTVNAQTVRRRSTFSYRGGMTPLDHPLAGRAVDAALRTCRALPGLRGYVGVDLVLAKSEAFVIELNPRLTTAYLGARMALDENVASLVLEACSGSLPSPLSARRRVRFTAGGQTTIVGPTADRGKSQCSAVSVSIELPRPRPAW
jgi:predicted ATP-grasp superfamily ATP-dependent carboligase